MKKLVYFFLIFSITACTFYDRKRVIDYSQMEDSLPPMLYKGIVMLENGESVKLELCFDSDSTFTLIETQVDHDGVETSQSTITEGTQQLLEKDSTIAYQLIPDKSTGSSLYFAIENDTTLILVNDSLEPWFSAKNKIFLQPSQ